MKALVDRSTGTVKGLLNFPFNFSVAGHYVVDVPSGLVSGLSTNSVTDLINAKNAAFQALHTALPGIISFEFLTIGGTESVDQTISSKVIVGADKRTALLPSGVIVTNPMTILTPFTKVFLHFHIHTLYENSGAQAPSAYNSKPDPVQVLYNYDTSTSSFVEPSLSNVTARIVDSTNSSILLTPAPDVETNYAPATPLTFRLRFTNNSATETFYMSDWLLLFG